MARLSGGERPPQAQRGGLPRRYTKPTTPSTARHLQSVRPWLGVQPSSYPGEVYTVQPPSVSTKAAGGLLPRQSGMRPGAPHAASV